MSRERSIIFFDIDGTLITDDGKRTFPDSAKEAIKLAQANGHLAFINTGRVFANVDDFIREAGFDGYVCGCGTYIFADGKELFHHKLPRNLCHEVALECRKYGMMTVFEHTDRTCYDKDIENVANSEILEYFKGMGRKIVDDIESPEFIFDKFASWYDANSDVEGFREYIEQKFTYISREGNFCEVVPKGFTKATGIQYLLDFYDIKLENAYALGDSNNDLDMLSYVPNSIAMGVCTPEVLETASYQTTTVLDDGVYKALKHFELI